MRRYIRGALVGSERWVKTYFWQGQTLNGRCGEVELSDLEVDGGATRAERAARRSRMIVALLTPAVFFHLIWWVLMIRENLFHLFDEREMDGDIPRYYMAITMTFVSFLAGATSEGGAAFAFPMMTLVFGVLPSVARGFSLMVQSVGMTSAAFAILYMRVKIEVHAVIFCTIGGVGGVILGLRFIASELAPAYAKMYFLAVWFAFGFSLYLLNRNRNRPVFDEIPNVWGKISWKIPLLVLFGFIGGIFTSISGSGIELWVFALLTLVFRVNEKIAAPTSVILIAMNACVGFIYRQLFFHGAHKEAWGYLAVCVPIVVIGAPLGSVLGSHFHRLAISALICMVDVAQFILGLAVVKPWLSVHSGGVTTTPAQLCVTTLLILIAGLIIFKVMERFGKSLAEEEQRREGEMVSVGLAYIQPAMLVDDQEPGSST